MNAETVTVKTRVLRSDLQQGTQCVVLWGMAICIVWAIHAHQLGFESYVLIGNILVAIGLPIFALLVVKLCQLASFAFMKRSKRYEFIDDVSRKSSDYTETRVVNMVKDENGRSIELGATKSNLALVLALYALVVLFSLLYKSEVYFIVALVLSVVLVVSSIFVLARNGFSINKALQRGRQSQSKDEIDALSRPEDNDSDLIYASIPNLDARVSFSRTWALTRLYYIGMWIPLFLAVPLIGQLFAGAFWLGVAVGVVYLFVIEMCALTTFFSLFERFFPSR